MIGWIIIITFYVDHNIFHFVVHRVATFFCIQFQFSNSYMFNVQDANSLAYYNIGPGTVLNLQLKERGGRKK